jgi:hypothetical protein
VDSRFCEGIPTNISAGGEHTGDAPIFVWKLNGSIVQVDFPSFFFSVFYNHAFANGDELIIEMTGNDVCATSTFATDTFIVITEPSITPVVTAVASDTFICPNDEITFTATGHNEGYNHDFNWYLNGQSLFNYDSVYVTNTLVDGDYLWCEYSTSAYCANPVSVASETFTIHVQCAGKTDEWIPIVDSKIAEVEPNIIATLYPNPANGKFFVSITGLKNDHTIELRMYNATGEIVYRRNNMQIIGGSALELNVSDILSAGVYLVRVFNSEFEIKKPLIITGK